jgi:hypothetical protein
VDVDRPRTRNLLGKTKDDILIQPQKGDFEEKLHAKEIERARKWQNMAIIERPNGSIHFRFPLSKKVGVLIDGVDDSCSNGRSKGFLIAGEQSCGTSFWIPRLMLAVTAKPRKN